MYTDLRSYLDEARRLGEVKVIKGADWNLEIGLITELQISKPDQPLLVFDNIKGYRPGCRVVSNFLNSPRLFALCHGLPLDAKGIGLVHAWRNKTKEGIKPVPPVVVKSGPIEENVHTGKDIDLFEFPTPKWHELDGGRYIGTGSMVIQRDPDEGWINVGTYRIQIMDKTTAAMHITPGRHGFHIRNKYWDKGLPCPVAVAVGGDPLLWSMAASPFTPLGVSEFDYVGWFRGEPMPVIPGKTVDLPIPAQAEIVLEGQLIPPGTEQVDEGPFGEWEGYYASPVEKIPPFKITAILHRNDPILLGAPPQLGEFDFYWGRNIPRVGSLWDELDKNTPGVKGVWMFNETRGPIMTVVSVKQMFSGHAKQIGMLVAGAYPSAYLNKYVVVVDDDIDPSNLSEVMWAIGTRCDPEKSIDILRDCWSSRSDPRIPPEKRELDDITCSKAIILACKPYHWMKQYPVSVKSRPELLEKTRAKWGKELFGA